MEADDVAFEETKQTDASPEFATRTLLVSMTSYFGFLALLAPKRVILFRTIERFRFCIHRNTVASYEFFLSREVFLMVWRNKRIFKFPEEFHRRREMAIEMPSPTR